VIGLFDLDLIYWNFKI